MNDGFYKRCINIISNLKLSYEEGIARDVILNELDILEKQGEDYQIRFNKAIEYIKRDLEINEKHVKEQEEPLYSKAWVIDTYSNLLNILQGSDE